MSREIKFRIWGAEIDGKASRVTNVRPSDIIEQLDGVFEICNNIPCGYVIEQFTGLKDKNGKEIHEGDIVKWLNGLGEYTKFRVEWQQNRARFCLRNEYSVYDYEDLNDKKEPYAEVIGNIHENGELLEEGK